MILDPETFDMEMLTELFEADILIFWRDIETNSVYVGLSTWARREIHQLPPIVDFNILEFESIKMTAKNARKGIEHAPSGRIDPVPERELTGIKGVEK